MEVLGASLVASEASIATVALRRVDPNVEGSIYDLLGRLNFSLLPNTAGCFSAAEAVKVAELAREAFGTNVVKLEVIGDDVTLLPDTSETLVAADRLVRSGFEVWAYTSDDLIVAQRLEQAGCVAVMPLGSPIGSGHGVRNPHAIARICERLSVPLLLDAGVAQYRHAQSLTDHRDGVGVPHAEPGADGRTEWHHRDAAGLFESLGDDEVVRGVGPDLEAAAYESVAADRLVRSGFEVWA